MSENFTMQYNQTYTNLSALQFNQSCAPIVEALGEPLLKNFNITHFGLIRMLENGQFLRIANNKEWSKKYFECEFYNDINMYSMGHAPLYETRFIPLFGAPSNSHCKALCEEFNIWNFMFIYEKFPTHGDFWFFGTTRENTQIINFYINNKSVLKHFTIYLKEKAADLINTSDPSKLISTNVLPLTEEVKNSQYVENFLRETVPDRYYLEGKYSGKFLSKSEWKCLFLFSQGRSMKEIAEKEKLSPRTVETYLNNIKLKIGCHTRGELLSAFSSIKTSSILS